MDYIHPRIRFWMDLGEILYEGAEAAAPALRKLLRRHRRRPYLHRRSGPETPLWNILVTLLRPELRRYGDKARLARYLGIPRQRLTDYLTGKTRRLPDAEMTLRLIHWLGAKQAGRDLSLIEPVLW